MMREEVLKILQDEYDAMDIIKMNDKLGLRTAEELRQLQDILLSLEKELIVYRTKKNRFVLYANCPSFRVGKLTVNKKGFGFLLLDGEEDVHISASSLGLALDGDKVLVELLNNDPVRREGRVVKVLERDLKNIVGIIQSKGKDLCFVPKKDVNIDLTIDDESLKKCVEGEVVVVSIVEDLGKNCYFGKVSKHICHKDDPMEDILTIAANHDIYAEFPDDVLKQIEGIPCEVQEEDKLGRIDLTDKVIFTIDGKDTKDIDDAIGLEIENDYYVLRVSIADVSYYVEENSPLDKEALKRGTSSYLAYSVIPMLPHVLSNGICSLNPGVERCALTCEMKIDHQGHVIDSQIYPSIISSVKKMNYDSVNAVFSSNAESDYQEYSEILNEMNILAHIIREERTRRGASDFDIPEPKIICDEKGIAVDIQTRERGDAERMIEDFMIVANETVSRTLSNMELPCIYRVHDVPKPEKIQEYINFCGATGHPIKGKFTKMNPKMFQKLLAQVDVDDRVKGIYRSLAVRSMPKAFYSENNIGHFGLASKYYSHFTSPIRRYPDLQLHRLIRTYLIENKLDGRTIQYWTNKLPSVAEQSSAREVAAVQAERDVDKMKMAEYMESHVGEEFEGVIIDTVGFGLFIQLDNLVEGLVPLSSINGDTFNYIEELHCLIGKNTKKRYSIGDVLRVKCVAASKKTSMIDFEIVKELKIENQNSKKKSLETYFKVRS